MHKRTRNKYRITQNRQSPPSIVISKSDPRPFLFGSHSFFQELGRRVTQHSNHGRGHGFCDQRELGQHAHVPGREETSKGRKGRQQPIRLRKLETKADEHQELEIPWRQYSHLPFLSSQQSGRDGSIEHVFVRCYVGSKCSPLGTNADILTENNQRCYEQPNKRPVVRFLCLIKFTVVHMFAGQQYAFCIQAICLHGMMRPGRLKMRKNSFMTSCRMSCC
mmetsp:Transcript_8274/g.15267  ORF Transcript_8274/g.15267 Transcript_8274/m.15267 type:complete len:220 (+) Transcript_8274:488-1147(+)